MSDNSEKLLDQRLADLQRDIRTFLETHRAFTLEKVEADNIVSANLQIFPIIQRDLNAAEKRGASSTVGTYQDAVKIMFGIQVAHYRPDIENPELWQRIYTTMPETARFLEALSFPPKALDEFNKGREQFQSDILRYISGEIEMPEALSRAVGADVSTLQKLRETCAALRAEQQQQSQG